MRNRNIRTSSNLKSEVEKKTISKPMKKQKYYKKALNNKKNLKIIVVKYNRFDIRHDPNNTHTHTLVFFSC